MNDPYDGTNRVEVVGFRVVHLTLCPLSISHAEKVIAKAWVNDLLIPIVISDVLTRNRFDYECNHDGDPIRFVLEMLR